MICIKKHITFAIKNSDFKGCSCPDCNKLMTYDEIKANVNELTFNLYLQLLYDSSSPFSG